MKSLTISHINITKGVVIDIDPHTLKIHVIIKLGKNDDTNNNMPTQTNRVIGKTFILINFIFYAPYKNALDTSDS